MFGSHPPQKRDSGTTRYRVKLALGKSMMGFLVGPIVGLNTHYVNRTVPCLSDVTKGRLKCYCSRMQLESVWKGYVPLIDKDGVSCFTQICVTYAELAYKAPLFAPVVVTRMTHKGAPYAVKYEQWSDIDPRSHFGIRHPVDLKPWLLKLWGDETLNKWLEDHPDANDQGVADELGVSMGQAVVKEVKSIIQERARGKLPETVGEVLKSVPGTNGKGKH